MSAALASVDLLNNLRHDQRTGTLRRAVLLISFALVTLAGNDAVGQAFTVWAYRHSAMVLGTLVLLIYFAVLVIERLREEQLIARIGEEISPSSSWDGWQAQRVTTMFPLPPHSGGEGKV